MPPLSARVVKLVDTRDLKSRRLRAVPVRPRPRAPITFLPFPAISIYILLFNDLSLIINANSSINLAISSHISRDFTNKLRMKLRTRRKSHGNSPQIKEQTLPGRSQIKRLLQIQNL